MGKELVPIVEPSLANAVKYPVVQSLALLAGLEDNLFKSIFSAPYY